MASAIPDITHAIAVKARVDALLEEKGLKHVHIYTHMGLSSSTYSDMWKNGYVTIDRLIGIAEALTIPAVMLLPVEHRGEQPSVAADPQAPYGKSVYIEQRIERLEAKVRKLTEQQRPK